MRRFAQQYMGSFSDKSQAQRHRTEIDFLPTYIPSLGVTHGCARRCMQCCKQIHGHTHTPTRELQWFVYILVSQSDNQYMPPRHHHHAYSLCDSAHKKPVKFSKHRCRHMMKTEDTYLGTTHRRESHSTGPDGRQSAMKK